MSYACSILADSVGPHGHRLTTFEVTFPRIVLADITRHRVQSYSFESTRAVPLEKRLEQVKSNPFIPTLFRSRAKGMGGGLILTGHQAYKARKLWLKGRDYAIEIVEAMEPNDEWPGISKELAGRLLEPYSWITGIISGTTWANLFGLRCPPIACVPHPSYPPQYELQVVAQMMREEYDHNEPEKLEFGDWHLPLIDPDEYTPDADRYWAHVSAGRCAAVSYLNHHKDSKDPDKAAARWEEKLAPSAHWSPGEHAAQCILNAWWWDESDQDLGNFQGFKQLRKFYPNEAIYVPVQQT